MIKEYKLTVLILLIASLGAKGQNILKGSVRSYNSDLETQGVNVIVLNPQSERYLMGSVVDSIGNFEIDSVPNGKIDLQLSFIGCYNTIITDIELNNDTIEIKNIPIFEADCVIEWDGICEKKILWGLIKYKKGCGGTENIEKSQFPENNQIFIDCKTCETDSILFELNPTTDKIKVEYKIIKTCGNNVYSK
ncbi:hypothetical protein EP331_11295 [bacterium]|nr:MAG: hypothetical protein EP331_11295 [bacterium]